MRSVAAPFNISPGARGLRASLKATFFLNSPPCCLKWLVPRHRSPVKINANFGSGHRYFVRSTTSATIVYQIALAIICGVAGLATVTSAEFQGRLIITAEDGGDTIRGRVAAMGGDARRIHILDEFEDFDSFSHDMARLDETLVRNPQIRFVVFDTLPDFIGEGIDDQTNQGVRQALKSLIRCAARRKITALGIAHFNKMVKTTAMPGSWAASPITTYRDRSCT